MSAALARRLRVMIVDDSAVARQVLSAVLTAAGMDVQVAPDPLFAWEKLGRWDPDVLVLDLEMPRMDGLTFLRRLRRAGDLPVVICSGTTDGRGEKALRALDEGAVEVVTKPKTAVREFLFESSVMLVDAVTAAAKTRATLRPGRLRSATPSLGPPPRPSTGRREIIALGASTGGPEAIRRVLGELPTTVPPVVVVQHMPAGFTSAFAKHLDQTCAIEVREAVSGDRLRPGLALIAPGGRHLRVQRVGAALEAVVVTGPLVSRHRPSVDVLFESVAECAGRNAVAALLTGMGDDGALGLGRLKTSGARTIAQDEATSVVYGMPKAAVDLGAVDETAPLEELAATILSHC
ncbi:MAG TPA: chemotaxis response regulator protein-glutamate methylesterase [Polyangiaceae bacterium]|nr:chemotaxis response regulator protein-glutamate methylesterase [Polyangiaceae bacterium]